MRLAPVSELLLSSNNLLSFYLMLCFANHPHPMLTCADYRNRCCQRRSICIDFGFLCLKTWVHNWSGISFFSFSCFYPMFYYQGCWIIFRVHQWWGWSGKIVIKLHNPQNCHFFSLTFWCLKYSLQKGRFQSSHSIFCCPCINYRT